MTDHLTAAREGHEAVRIVVTPHANTAVVAETTTWEMFPELWRELLAEVWTFLRGSGLTTVGTSCGTGTMGRASRWAPR
jgi:hypothetical protein